MRSRLFVAFAAAASAACGRSESAGIIAGDGRCDPAIALPEGFCAVVVADSVGPARHLAVRANGDIYVAVLDQRRQRGGIVAIRDSLRDGRPQRIERFGEAGAYGVAMPNDSVLYVATATAILRYRLSGDLVPSRAPDTMVVGLPPREPPSHSLAMDARGTIYVGISAETTACEAGEAPGSAGLDPCPELDRAGGIWTFRGDRTMQRFEDGVRYATGLRAPAALTVKREEAEVYAVSRGRGMLHERWPELYDDYEAATRPGDEFVRVVPRANYGWPYCYYNVMANRRVVAPEYGGDKEMQGRCELLTQPLLAFPAHWTPSAITFHRGDSFPVRYRNGAFIAFEGSSDRAPLPQEGYHIVYVTFRDELPSGPWEFFAEGFDRGIRSPTGALHRPAGLAFSPDGALYVSDGKGGRIWRVVYIDP